MNEFLFGQEKMRDSIYYFKSENSKKMPAILFYNAYSP